MKFPASTHPAPETTPKAEKRPYEMPAVAWEQPFVALAQSSQITNPNCIPGMDPRCTN